GRRRRGGRLDTRETCEKAARRAGRQRPRHTGEDAARPTRAGAAGRAASVRRPGLATASELGHPQYVQRILPFLVFLAIALTLIGGMHYYVWARLVRDPHLPPLAARVLTLAIVALGVSLPLAMIASRLF